MGINNLNDIHSTIEDLMSSLADIRKKAFSGHQQSYATVSEITNLCSNYKIIYDDDPNSERNAVLAYASDFYEIHGFPANGDRVMVMHDDYKNSHILYVSTQKDFINNQPAKILVLSDIPFCKAGQ